MNNTNKKVIIFKRKDRTLKYRDIQIVEENAKSSQPIQIVEEDAKFSQPIQIVTETKICKYIESKYVNSPSREIKKWFELRKI